MPVEAARAPRARGKERGAGEGELEQQRPSAARRGYGPRWRRARAEYLARHPLCGRCQADGRIKPATTVDHIVPHRGDQKLFWDEGQLGCGMCKRCHDAKQTVFWPP